MMPRRASTRAALLVLLAIADGTSGCEPATRRTAERSPGSLPGQPLVADENGRIDRATTGTTGIQGRWVARVDSADCLKGKHERQACSTLIGPDPRALTVRPMGDLGICALGVLAGITLGSDEKMDYAHVWGASIDFDLELVDGKPYDARAHGVTGLAFHIDAEPPPGAGLRVRFVTEGAREDPPFWGGGSSESSPVHAGRNELRWADVGGPIWVDKPPPFDPSRLLAIWFHIAAVPRDARSFSFCINDLVALRD